MYGMNMKKLFGLKIEKIVSISYSLCCYGCSIYMMGFLFCKYYDNEDSSKVEMKQFHDSPSGRYPSFTFCLSAEDGNLFKAQVLQNEFGMTQEEYYQQLTGGLDAASTDLTPEKFNRVITEIDDFLVEFEAEDSSFQMYNEWKAALNLIQSSPFHSSYQDPTTNCFTYNTEYSESVSLRQIDAKLNITKIQLQFHKLKLYIMVHYPGQLIRNIRNYVYKLKYWNKLKIGKNNNQVVLSFSGLTIMRRRENAVNPCNPELIDDDAEWKKHATKAIGCIPPYWNNNGNHYFKPEKICDSKHELDSIKAYWPREDNVPAKKVFQNYTRPCNSFEQLIFNSYSSYYRDHDILKIRIKLQNDMYQEVRNTKAFGIAELWANIGGYVGIFCGFSLLQTTTYLIDNIKESIIHFKT